MMAENRSRHRLNAAMTRIKLRGLDGIDQRTTAARNLLEWRAQLVADLGGEANLTAQKSAMVEMACRTRALLDHADGWILAQPSIINKRHKRLLPIIAQRQTLCDSLARLLRGLGLERQGKPVNLQSVLADIAAERDSRTVDGASETGQAATIAPEDDPEAEAAATARLFDDDQETP
jgi:hypothetical protein